ncbi:MAG TPA: hypothetical protein VFN56_05215, partial [Candidatus Saccharimonadales bacterium]|nr:hypothetical protein [Candidatus Saccharimonadales bacterium]
MANNRTHSSDVRYDDKHLEKVFPKWLPRLYGAACICLIPWTIFLAVKLPPHYQSHHWDAAWTGFDVFLIIAFALTAWLAVKKSSWTALTATALGTILIMDAWFDILTAKPGKAQHEAIAESF